MDDPLLSTLCSICHIDPPKYTCPACSAQTCSLTCSKRHKLWSSCNGVRDPTTFRPMSVLATPSGIDHDYNFLHGIETSVARTEKVLIEDLGIVSRDELERARTGESEEDWRRRTRKNTNEPPGEVQMERCLKEKNIRVVKAPKGMRRNKENTSNWNKKHRVIHWQVEWVREGGRGLYKGMGSFPIGDVYEAFVEEERKLKLTDKEKAAEKKRKAADIKARAQKRARLDLDHTPTPLTLLQDPETGAWNFDPMAYILTELDSSESIPQTKQRNFNLYLHRPLTPASFPKVLAPIDPEKNITDQLGDRDVLDFPTIYVFPHDQALNKEAFMLEQEYLQAIGEGKVDTKMNGVDKDTEDDEDDDESCSDSSDSDSSSDESSSDEEMEDGEVV